MSQLLSPFATGSLGVTVAYVQQMQDHQHHDGVFIVDNNHTVFFSEDGDSGDIDERKQAECDNSSVKSFDSSEDDDTSTEFSDDDDSTDGTGQSHHGVFVDGDFGASGDDPDTPVFFSLVQFSAKPGFGVRRASREEDDDDDVHHGDPKFLDPGKAALAGEMQ